MTTDHTLIALCEHYTLPLLPTTKLNSRRITRH